MGSSMVNHPAIGVAPVWEISISGGGTMMMNDNELSSFSTQHAQRWVLARKFVMQWVFLIVMYLFFVFERSGKKNIHQNS